MAYYITDREARELRALDHVRNDSSTNLSVKELARYEELLDKWFLSEADGQTARLSIFECNA